MNFRNISSWCIRNPVAPIVLFVGLMLAGLVAFARMDVNNDPDIDFPAAIVIVSQPGAAPNEMETQVTQRVEVGGPRRQRRRRDQQHGHAKATATPSSSSSSARRPTARSTTCATRSPRSAATCPTASSSRRSRASTPRTSRSSYVGAETTDMTLEQLSWYIDNTVAKRLLGVRGHRRGQPRRRRRPRDPRDPRSGRAAGAGHHRRAGQPAAAPEQHQRRRRPRRDRRLRAVGARARQRPATPTSCRRPRSRSAAAASSGSPTSARSRTAIREQRSIAKMNGRQVVTFDVQRAKGSSEVTVYDAAHGRS